MGIKLGIVSIKYQSTIFITTKRNNYLIMKNILLLGALVMFAFTVSAQSDAPVKVKKGVNDTEANIPAPPNKESKASCSKTAEGEKKAACTAEEKAACSGKKDGDKACCAKSADGSKKTCTAEEKAACCSKSTDDKSSNSKSKEKGKKKKTKSTMVGISE